MSAIDRPRQDAPVENGALKMTHDSNGAPGAAHREDLLGRTIARLSDDLEVQGCRLDRDPDFLKRYNLDAVITRIQAIHAHVNLGIRVNVTNDDLDCQAEFLETSRRGVVHKAIYVEISEQTLSTGAIPVAISACMAFLFDRRYSHFKSIGLRVFEDCTFHYFDVEENVRRLRRDSQHLNHRIGQELTGHIIAYFTDKGFGFIEAEKDQKFFFHIANVVDDELRVQLPTYQPGELVPVLFKYGGSDGKKYPKAVDVILDEEEYEDDDDDDYEDDDEGDY